MSSAMRVHIWRLREELNSSMAEQAKFICEIESLKVELAGLRQANEVLRGQLEEKEMYANYWRRTAENLRRDLRSEVIICTLVIMNFFVFSQNNRGRRGSDEILKQALARSEAEREITGRAYLTLKHENQDLLRENRELKDKIRVLEGKQRDLETKNRELDGKYQLCLGKVEGMAGAERDRISKMAGLYREINDLRSRISRN